MPPPIMPLGSLARLIPWLLGLLLACSCAPPSALARPPDVRVAALRQGINITAWFRYPASRDPAALRSYMGDRALADLRQAGFGFVRLAVDPALTEDPVILRELIEAIRRINRARLAVVVSIHPDGWRLETSQIDQNRLLATWKRLATTLRPLDPGQVFPEVLNEPVFPRDPAGWHRLQRSLLGVIRPILSSSTIVLTGHDWGSIAGLEALTPEADSNVIYSIHLYDPSELTSLAAYRPGLDRAAVARLPFPVLDPEPCEAASDSAADRQTRDLMRYYCSLRWDEARVGQRIAAAAAWARRHDAVLLAGEFGATVALNPAARLRWLRAVREGFGANGIGWALWGYDDVMGLAIGRPPGLSPTLNADVLHALGLRGTETRRVTQGLPRNVSP
jgi:hypothetical protein